MNVCTNAPSWLTSTPPSRKRTGVGVRRRTARTPAGLAMVVVTASLHRLGELTGRLDPEDESKCARTRLGRRDIVSDLPQAGAVNRAGASFDCPWRSRVSVNEAAVLNSFSAVGRK